MPVFYRGNGLRAGHSSHGFASACFESTPIQGCCSRHTDCLHYCKHTSENIEIKSIQKNKSTHIDIYIFPFNINNLNNNAMGVFFFGSILLCCSSGNHPSVDLVKFWQYSKYENRKSFSYGKQLW